MWDDNEADFDLLGFEYLVDGLVIALTEPRLLPLTVGVLGDWGSGKSSLMSLAGREIAGIRAELEGGVEGQDAKARYMVIDFSPWQHEDYDDVKAALMTSILDALLEGAPELDVQIGKLRKIVEGLKKMGRRGGRLGAGVAGNATPLVLQIVAPDLDPALVGLTTSGVSAVAGDVKSALADPEPKKADGQDQVEYPNEIKTFRKLFNDLVMDTSYDAVIVLIDDLDRCLPETVVDTFEAIRLFLNTPKTAYVMALNQTVVEAAIDSRYPDLKKDDGAGIGRDYLEKMLQLKVAIPPLSAPEAETYVNLLFAELHLGADDFAKALGAASELRATGQLSVAFNTGIAGKALGDIPSALATDLAWAAEVTPILGSSLRGNPRQLKRFLNNLLLKYRSAARRKINLELPVLAKLMVLEDQNKTDFQKLFDWEIASGGMCPEVIEAENEARGVAPTPATPPAKKALATATATKAAAAPPASTRTEAQNWATKPHMAAWLRAEPPLKGVDLRKYFTYSRDKLSFGVSASRLSPALQQLLTQVQNEMPVPRRASYAAVKELDGTERAQFMEALLERVERSPGGVALTSVLELAEQNPDIVQQVCDALKRIPPTSIPPETATIAVRRLPASDSNVAGLLDTWENSDNTTLKGVLASARSAQGGGGA